MLISQAFPSKYVAAPDLQGQDFAATIATVVVEEVGSNEHLPVVYFHGQQKGLVLNKTNATTIAEAYGDDTDGWIGKPVTLFPTETEYQGKRVACIRVRVIPGGVQLPPQPPTTHQQPERPANPQPSYGNPSTW